MASHVIRKEPINMSTPMTMLIRGSAKKAPVVSMMRAATMAPTDARPSPSTWMNAARTLSLARLSRNNIAAVARLAISPAVAMASTGPLWTSGGSAKRWLASQKMKAAMRPRAMLLIRAASTSARCRP